jgi:hypothetical protein
MIVINHELDVGIVYGVDPLQRFLRSIHDVAFFTSLRFDCDRDPVLSCNRAGSPSKIDQLIERLLLGETFVEIPGPLLPKTMTLTPKPDIANWPRDRAQLHLPEVGKRRLDAAPQEALPAMGSENELLYISRDTSQRTV